MDFKDALFKVGEVTDNIYNIIDPFFLYSHLADYSKSTLEKKDKIKLYYKMLRVVNFYEFILLNGIDEGRSMILDRYQKVESIMDFVDYIFFLNSTIEMILRTKILNDYMNQNLSRKVVNPYVNKKLPKDTIYYSKNRGQYIHLDRSCPELEKTKTIYQKILPLDKEMKVCAKCANAKVVQKEGNEHQFLSLVDVLFNTEYNTTKITKKH